MASICPVCSTENRDGANFCRSCGIKLYWITNNVLSIAQQWFINKRLGVLGTK